MPFSPFGPPSPSSSAPVPPSQYDRYRESFSTVSSLLDSLARNDKNHLFEDVHTFFMDKKKDEGVESKKLASLESENMEQEESVEQSRRTIAATIQAKELHTIKTLHAYSNPLRQSHRAHTMTSLAAVDVDTQAKLVDGVSGCGSGRIGVPLGL
jgi:dGTP triphosphohydrolase